MNDTALMLLLGVFFITIFLKLPICFALGLASVSTMLYLGIPLANIINIMYASLDSYPFLAVPLFMLVGSLMNGGGITDRLMNVSSAWVGHIRGGLGHVNVGGCQPTCRFSGVKVSRALPSFSGLSHTSFSSSRFLVARPFHRSGCFRFASSMTSFLASRIAADSPR